MRIKIPFTNKVLVIELENTLDQQILDIVCKRYLNYNKEWSIDRIAGIKFYRSINPSLSLTDAKEYIDNLILINRIPPIIMRWEKTSIDEMRVLCI